MANRDTGSQGNNVYIREVLHTDHDAIARLLTRAFTQDPSMNWFGSVPRLVPVPSADDMKNTPLWRLLKELELIYYFFNAYLVSAHLPGCHIIVAVRPEPDVLESEKVVSVAAWFPPAARIDGPLIILKSKQHRTLWVVEATRRMGITGSDGEYQMSASSYCLLILMHHGIADSSRGHTRG